MCKAWGECQLSIKSGQSDEFGVQMSNFLHIFMLAAYQRENLPLFWLGGIHAASFVAAPNKRKMCEAPLELFDSGQISFTYKAKNISKSTNWQW